MACEKVKKLKVQFCRYYFTFTTKDSSRSSRKANPKKKMKNRKVTQLFYTTGGTL